MLNLVLGFVLGAFSIIFAQALCVYILFHRFFRKNKLSSHQTHTPIDHHHQSLAFASNKQGIVWVLDLEKVPKLWYEDKLLKEQNSKKEILDVFPVKKLAKIVDHSLILTDSNASQVTIDLMGCTVLSVSASNLSSRKWAKRYPIKVESRSSVIYKGSKICYLYLETSWEKESWCKALRLASCVNKERTNWYAELGKEFHDYLASLKAGYPSFMKPSTGVFCEPTDRTIRADVSSSKVRLFLKKLAKKASKSSLEIKAGGTSVSVSEEKKMGEKSRSVQNSTGSTKNISTEKTANNYLGEDTVLPLPLSFTQSGSQNQVPVISDADFDDKFSIDEGTVCWNLLISRLFFDAKRNTDMKNSIQARIQRTLSNMRTPSYIGGVTCTSLNVGTLPPYIHSMRVLPTDMNEVWAMEIDIEYSGGAILDIETRIEVREADFEKGIVNSSIDSSAVDEASSDLLEGFEHFGNQLKLSGEIGDEIENRDSGDIKFDAMRKNNSWKLSYTSRWKCILNSIANQVSQVPLSLTIKIASVRGTLRLHIKPPPSDQLWFGFTSMPEIDFNLESSVGEHKFSGAHVAMLLENRFKAAIRETLVLPNCEGVCIPWMLAEKDDWAPRKIAPFSWVNQEITADPAGCDLSGGQPGEIKSKLEASKVTKLETNNHLESKGESLKSVASAQQLTREPAEDLGSLPQSGLSSSNNSFNSNRSLHDLKTPLLPHDTCEASNSSRSESPDNQPVSRSVSVNDKQVHINEDGNSKRIGRKARMMDLGKKMGEKLEEKRRNIEEKSRNIVEKMRGP
ncbi:Testis-expressed protein [Thalictrum thalictroides]|uniref:Testis-expressed protein n=1 Tax=Thalictrum thalictroides TaxID=46969 RepID=A0A7J6VLU9_THATH|nr:Testis-expressed protein [Thalictrum thalictroides]